MANGSRTSSTERESRRFPTVPCIMVSTSKDRSTEKAASAGPMEARTRAISRTIISMATVPSRGVMVANLPGSGSTTRWRARASSPGLTAESTKANTKKTLSRAMEFSGGLMAKNTKDNGRMESRMARACTRRRTESQEKASGRRARG